MPVDVSFVTYFAPIAAFFLVFLVCALLLLKTKILGESKWMALFLSLLIAALFVSFAGVRRYIELIVPWFAVFLLSLFFILLLTLFSGKIPEGLQKGVGVLFIIGLLGAFIISGIVVFSDQLGPWLPGSIESYGNPVYDWLFAPSVLGALLLVILTIAVSWVLLKKS